MELAIPNDKGILNRLISYFSRSKTKEEVQFDVYSEITNALNQCSQIIDKDEQLFIQKISLNLELNKLDFKHKVEDDHYFELFFYLKLYLRLVLDNLDNLDKLKNNPHYTDFFNSKSLQNNISNDLNDILDSKKGLTKFNSDFLLIFDLIKINDKEFKDTVLQISMTNDHLFNIYRDLNNLTTDLKSNIHSITQPQIITKSNELLLEFSKSVNSLLLAYSKFNQKMLREFSLIESARIEFEKNALEFVEASKKGIFLNPLIFETYSALIINFKSNFNYSELLKSRIFLRSVHHMVMSYEQVKAEYERKYKPLFLDSKSTNL